MTTPGNTYREIEHARDRLGRWIEMNAAVTILGGSTGRVIGGAPYGRIDVRRADGAVVRVSPGHVTVTDEPAVRKVTTSGRGRRLAPERVAGEPEQIDLFAFAESEPTPDPKPADVQPSTEGRKAVEDVLAADADPEDDEAEVTDEDWRRPPTEFEFPAYRLADATAKIDQANRRAERAGIAERFGYSIERFEVTRTTDKDGNRLAFPYIEERIRLTLDRPSVQHDGWTFVATLSWDPEAGLVTRVVPDATLGKRPEARHCDVCNSKRDRKDTYVIQNAEGEERQVGSNCLAQFMGLRPASLWMLDYSPDMPGDDDEDGGYGGGGGESRYDTLGLLRLALAMVSKRGWVSRGTASVDYTKRATADLMGDYMAGQFHKSKDVGEQQFARELDDLVDDEGPLAEEAVAVRDFARTMDGDSEYVLNLRAVAAADSVSSRNLALLASAVAAKQRHDGYVAERKAKAEATGDSKHQGTVGAKLANVPVKITGTKRIEGDYGVSTLISFIDGEGNVYKWFSSAFDGEFEIGDDVLMSGTVKGHGEFRGVPETSMTRAKLKATGERGAAEAAEEARMKAEAAAAKKMTKVAVPPGYAAYGGEPLDLYTVVRVVDEDARTKAKPYIDVVLTQITQVPGDDSTRGWYVRPADGRGFRAGVVTPSDIVAVKAKPVEAKALPGEHTDYTPPSAPGSQTAVPPGLARVAMLSETEEYEVEIPDERYKREGGHDQAFKGGGLDLFEDDVAEPDRDAPDEEDDREAKTIARGTYVTWGDGGQGTVDLVVLEGRVPGFDASVVATKSDPMARVRLPDGTGFAIEVKRLQPTVPPSPEVKGYAALNALVQEQGLPLGLDAATMAKAYGRGLKGWPGEDVTSLSQHDWAMGRTKALLAARMGEVIPGFADEDLLP